MMARWENEREESLRIDRWDLDVWAAAQRDRRVELLLRGQTDIATFMLESMAQLDKMNMEHFPGTRDYPRKPRAQDKIVGGREQPIRAKRLVWLKPSQKPFAWLTSSREYGGEWVFFLLSRVEYAMGSMWSTSTTTFDRGAQNRQLWIFKNCNEYDADVSENVFDAFLSSFRLLRGERWRS
jgi:hypothetical protein